MNATPLSPNELPSTDGDAVRVRDQGMWSTSIGAEPMDGGLSYHADIFENGVFVCRIALSGRFDGEAAAESELNRRLNLWIAEYEKRSEKSGLNGSETSCQCDRP